MVTGATQCGFCTPGILVNARALLERNPDPTDAEIREALVGNLCRCTGYMRIIDAVQAGGAPRKGGGARSGLRSQESGDQAHSCRCLAKHHPSSAPARSGSRGVRR